MPIAVPSPPDSAAEQPPRRPRTITLVGPALALALTLAGPAGTAAPVPERFIASYDLLALGQTIGDARWTLAPEPRGRFRFESVTRARGLWTAVLPGERREESLWEYDGSGRPRPLLYRAEASGSKPRRARIEFDWAAGVAASAHKDRSWRLPLAAGTLDPLVYVLALMQDLASGRATLAYTFAERGKVKTYTLLRQGTEAIETGLGPIETVRLARRDDEGRETTLWCAAALGHVPVQIEHREPGTPDLTARLRAIEGLDLAR